LTLAESGRALSPADPLYADVLEFLYHEAELLDSGRFSDWLDLLAEDLSYRLPIRLNRARAEGGDVSDQTEIFRDNRASLALRVRRLGTGYAWAETPPSRTRHLVSNVRVRATDNPHELAVSSCFLVYRSRSSEPTPDLFSGERQDLLRRTDDGWRLARRTILLDQAVIGARHLSIFL
jgi:3-phenylpropionate/cinnamic acid dioxygenase small subunit